MENASKALIIAGGILLAIITLSLIVYMTTATARIGEAQDEKTAAEQLAAFNMEWEAYNKRVMYGTEIMSIANKAIEYNGNLTDRESQKAINITIKIKDDFTATKHYKTEYSNGKTEESDPTVINEWSISGGSDIIINFNTDGKIINLFTDQSVKDEIRIIEETRTYIKKEIIYSALTNFKRAIFKCTNVHYNENTGRIDGMTFEQK